MRVFVTGATGFVGSAVVRELLDHGHRVVGLVRSADGEATLRAEGADAVRGSLTDLDALRAAAASADATIHTGFNHDFSRFAASCAEDGAAIRAMGDALAGSARPLIVTAGLTTRATGRLATETDPPIPTSATYPRETEAAAATVRAQGVRVATVRLPPSTHGAGDRGFVPILMGIAREKGVSAFVGDGANLWAATHRFDAAVVYRLALADGAQAPVYHAVAEEGVPFRRIAEAIGQALGLPVEGRDGADAAAHFGWFGKFAGIDLAASSAATRARLGWTPTQIELLADLATPGYA